MVKRLISKGIIYLLVFVFSLLSAFSQSEKDSLLNRLRVAKNDTERVDRMNKLAWYYVFSYIDTSIQIAKQSLKLAKSISYSSGEGESYVLLVLGLSQTGNFAESAAFGLEGISAMEKARDTLSLAALFNNMMICYRDQEDYVTALDYGYRAMNLRRPYKHDTLQLSLCLGLIGSIFERTGRLDTAMNYCRAALKLNSDWSGVLLTLGDIHLKRGNPDSALFYYRSAIPVAARNHVNIDLVDLNNNISGIFESRGQSDSALWYARHAISQEGSYNYLEGLMKARSRLASIYRKLGKQDSVIRYQELAMQTKDQLFSRQKTREAHNLLFDQKFKDQELSKMLSEAESRKKINFLLAGLVIFIVGLLLLWRNNRQKQEAKLKVEKAYDGLQLAQTELQHKNRELEIEASLEGVRARTMAMNKSEELGEVIYVLLEKLKALGVVSSVQSAVMMVFEPGYRVFTQWVVSDWMPKAIGFRTPFIENQILVDFWEAKECGIDFYEKPYAPEQKNALFDYFFQLLKVEESDPSRKIVYEATQYAFCAAIEKNSAIAVASFSGTLLTPAESEILKRFARMFEQCYIRFMDLKKAEAQAHESKIEAALERIRAGAMAMQSSAELGNIIETVYHEFGGLDISIDRALIMIFDTKTNVTTWWMASPEGGSSHRGYDVQKYDHPLDAAQWQGWNEHEEKWQYLLEGESKKSWDNYLFNKTGLVELPDPVKDYMQSVRSVHLSASFANFGGLMAATIDPLSGDQFEIVLRFAKVFDLAYTRFNDLKQAEKSAKEAKIELALERVRSRTMAMQKSEELSDVAELLFKQVSDLGIKTWTSGFNVWSDDNSSYVDYITNPLGGFMEPYTIHTDQAEMFAEIREARKSGSEFFVQYGDGERLRETYLALNKQADKNQFDKIREAGFDFPSHQYDHFVFGAKLSLMFITYEPVPEAHDIFKRLGKVFEQTYTRFQDLQRAEAQALEATIEASLEKVRGKAMAMRNSQDLVSTAGMVFTELRKLGISPIRCGVGLLTRDSRKAQLYSATLKTNADRPELLGWVELSGHPILTNIYDTWLKGEDFYPELAGLELKTYYEQLLSGLSVPFSPDWQSGKKEFGHFFPFTIGCFYAWSEVHYNDREIKILKRFAGIIDLTFRRYLELQKSEANAKGAIRQASLDRVRAEIASMRTTKDLERITPLIWNELKTMDVPFVRCGVFIMDEEKRQSHTFLSTPDGRAIAAFHLPFDSTKNIGDVVEHWRLKKDYLSHWNKAEFSTLGDILLQQGSIASKDQYMNSIPGDGIWLHLLPFLQGMLYVGNYEALSEEDMLLVKSLAGAFSTAYSRYEDFNRLEGAKKQVENTLTDLKQAQQQLIQSEKMASLGELTAGIAHEIQNPLNFVNNFSDVSAELLGEMAAEMRKGHNLEAMAIAEDVMDNLGKILHHGKRADAIVKGMLQHSRTSSGQKEPTDLNILADEYLRLAYHGLRAKDKTFNANFKTDFEEGLKKLDLIPQDIGRVLVNLINNAFFAVNVKKKENIAGYEPIVTVSTRKLNDTVILTVSDNGIGMSQKLQDKIFQPFFTTKPTGQGTGLGLSLSYDIVKAHGGELNVESKEGGGSSFIISLPAENK